MTSRKTIWNVTAALVVLVAFGCANQAVPTTTTLDTEPEALQQQVVALSTYGMDGPHSRLLALVKLAAETPELGVSVNRKKLSLGDGTKIQSSGKSRRDCWATYISEVGGFLECVVDTIAGDCEDVSAHYDPAGPAGAMILHAECKRYLTPPEKPGEPRIPALPLAGQGGGQAPWL